MKKTLIALAAMAAAGVASAQSSVTLFGIVDVALERGTASNGGQNKTQLTSGAYNTSRLGVRGTEDLGGGMSASFWLEAGLNADDGTGQASSSTNQAIGNFNGTTGANAPVRSGTQGLVFNRRSTVSLGGGFGELRLGRDYTPTYWNHNVFDPFGTVGVGATMTQGLSTFPGSANNTTLIRSSNSIGYFLPANLGGVYGQAMYYLGENNSGGVTDKNGDGFGVRVGFSAGPVNVALAHGRTKVTGTGDSLKETNLGGQLDFGVARLMANVSQDKLVDVKGTGFLLGGMVPVGAGEIKLAYSQYKVNPGTGGLEPKTRKLALGYVHNLSKRTAVYATVARARNTDGAATALGGATTGTGDFNSTGMDLGLRHSF